MGRCIRADAIHAECLQKLRRRCRSVMATATLSTSIPDLLFSTANYFKKHGWETEQTWGYEVVVPQNFNFMLADRSKVMTIREWEHLGSAVGGKPFPRFSDRAFLMVPAGSQGAWLPDAQ